MEITDYKVLKITRTESWVVNAFLVLLKRYSFEEVTVTRICQDADIARVTFYRNFDSKEAVLRLYIRTLADDYFSKIKETGIFTLENLAKGYFTYWKEHADLIEILNKNSLSNILLDEFSSVESYLADIEKEHPIIPKPKLTQTEAYYFHAYNFAGLWRMIFLWAERNYQESVEEMTSIYLKTVCIIS